MKRIILVLAGLALIGANQISAQEPSATPVILPKPILAKLPANVAWTVSIISQPDSAEKETGSSGNAKPSASPKKVFIKTDPLLEVIKIDAAGQQMQQWRVGDNQYLVSPGSSNLGVMDPKSDEYIKGEFQELRWIKDSNFVGVVPYKGMQCWVFKDRVFVSTPQEFENSKNRAKEENLPFNENNYYAEEVAYVDSKTQLPVLLKQGGQIYEYTYGNPPGSLKMPAVLEKKVETDSQRNNAMQAGPPRPF